MRPTKCQLNSCDQPSPFGSTCPQCQLALCPAHLFDHNCIPTSVENIAVVLPPQPSIDGAPRPGRPRAPGRPCTICEHPQVDLIHEDMAGWTLSAKEICAKYDLNIRTYQNHRRQHLPQDIAIAIRQARAAALSLDQTDLADIAITSKINRLETLEELRRRMEMVISERAAAHQDVPGGRSGLVAVEEKRLGSGENTRDVTIARFDSGLVREMREVLDQARAETEPVSGGGNGGRTAQVAIGGGSAVQININEG